MKKVDSAIHKTCIITDESLQKNTDAMSPMNAGCIIEQDGKILLLEGAFSFEDFRRMGKILIPGGTNNGESAACTAMQETFEESGIEVEIQGVIGVRPNNFVIFDCKAKKTILESDLQYKKLFEVRKIMLVNISELSDINSKIYHSFLYSDDRDFLANYYLNRHKQ